MADSTHPDPGTALVPFAELWPPATRGGLAGFVADGLRTLAARRRAARAHRELARLDDRLLRDIGVMRIGAPFGRPSFARSDDLDPAA
jgi:uncharacterized protein YjiS (DUF1127 family)